MNQYPLEVFIKDVFGSDDIYEIHNGDSINKIKKLIRKRKGYLILKSIKLYDEVGELYDDYQWEEKNGSRVYHFFFFFF
jgi:hypothetical protein